MSFYFAVNSVTHDSLQYLSAIASDKRENGVYHAIS